MRRMFSRTANPIDIPVPSISRINGRVAPRMSRKSALATAPITTNPEVMIKLTGLPRIRPLLVRFVSPTSQGASFLSRSVHPLFSGERTFLKCSSWDMIVVAVEGSSFARNLSARCPSLARDGRA